MFIIVRASLAAYDFTHLHVHSYLTYYAKLRALCDNSLAVPCGCSHDSPHQVRTALIFMMPARVLAEHEPEPTVIGKAESLAKIEFKVSFVPL